MRYAATILAVLLGTCLLAQNYTADRVTIKTGGTLKMRPGSVLELAGYGVTAISNDPTAGSSSTTSLITEAGAKGYANTRGRVDSAALVQSGKAVYLVCYSTGGDTLAVDTVSIGGVGGAFVSGDSVFLVINGDTVYSGLNSVAMPIPINGLAWYADSIGLGGKLDRIAYIRAETDAGLYLVNADTTKGLTLGQVVSFFSDAGSSHFVALPDSSISLALEDGGKLQVQGEIGGSAQWRARMSGGREAFDDFRADKRGREYAGHYPGIKGHPRSIPDVGLVNEMLSDSLDVLRDSLAALRENLDAVQDGLVTVQDSLDAFRDSLSASRDSIGALRSDLDSIGTANLTESDVSVMIADSLNRLDSLNAFTGTGHNKKDFGPSAFAGSTIPDYSNIHDALQSLETAVESGGGGGGGAPSDISDLRASRFVVFDDFVDNLGTANRWGDYHWVSILSSATDAYYSTYVKNHPGILNMLGHATNTFTNRLTLNASGATALPLRADTSFVFEIAFSMPYNYSTLDGVLVFGLAGGNYNILAEPADGIYVATGNGFGGTVGKTNAASVTTVNFANDAAKTGAYDVVRITYDDTTGTVEFFMNGVSQGTSTTNIYTGDMRLDIYYTTIAGSAGATVAAGVYVDYVYFSKDLNR
jgi:hypothetical protein